MLSGELARSRSAAAVVDWV